jgi:hypothetical protein
VSGGPALTQARLTAALAARRREAPAAARAVLDLPPAYTEAQLQGLVKSVLRSVTLLPQSMRAAAAAEPYFLFDADAAKAAKAAAKAAADADAATGSILARLALLLDGGATSFPRALHAAGIFFVSCGPALTQARLTAALAALAGTAAGAALAQEPACTPEQLQQLVCRVRRNNTLLPQGLRAAAAAEPYFLFDADAAKAAAKAAAAAAAAAATAAADAGLVIGANAAHARALSRKSKAEQKEALKEYKARVNELSIAAAKAHGDHIGLPWAAHEGRVKLLVDALKAQLP